jgi:branched-chain amino acid transport system permease protein
MIYFLIAVGLTMIFGIMGVLNFAHGALYMLGGILTVVLIGFVANFFVGMLIAAVLVAVFGALFERTLLRPLYDRDPIYQLLLTFGASLVLINAAQYLWGTEAELLSPPNSLTGISFFGPVALPHYRVFIIALGLAIAALLYLALERTRFGILIRAATRDSAMVRVLGHDSRLIFIVVFAIGSGLAALGGASIGPLTGVYPSMGIEILIPAFVVVIIGGLGSIMGTFFASILIGEVIALTSVFWSEGSQIMMFTLLIVVLLLKPEGLFGEEGVVE